LKDDLELLSLYDHQVCGNERPISYFVQDESRFGLKTLIGRVLTAAGIKPIGTWQWLFKAFWLDGAVKPATGASFFLQFSHVDTECFQRFLDEFPQAYPDSQLLAELTPEIIAGITGYPFILDALSVINTI
jgi:hypothetical protein